MANSAEPGMGVAANTPPRVAGGDWADDMAAFLRAELAPFPGRAEAVTHYAVCVTLAMLAAFFLQIPMLHLAIIIFFFTIMENTAYTFLASALVIGGTLLVGVIDNVFLGLTIDYPLLRVFIAGFMVFLGMWFFRAGTVLGTLGYMWSLCIIFFQSNMPLLPSGELMLRINLWSAAVSIYAAALACLVSALVRPAWPSRLLPEEMARQLENTAEALDARINGRAARPLSLAEAMRESGVLRRLLEQTVLEGEKQSRHKNRRQAEMAALSRVRLATASLGALPPANHAPASAGDMAALKETCLNCAEALRRGLPFGSAAIPERPGHGQGERGGDSGERAVAGALGELGQALSALMATSYSEYPPFEGGKTPLFKPDAAANPTYARFALKTLLAAAICLGFYKSTQWEGIHTCMITCIVVAQPGLAATRHKALLRVIGCLAGSAIAVFAAVFLIPHMEDVTWHILLCLAVLLPAAWIAVGSPRSNYAGVQIAFAYALALMTQNGPAVDLAEIRDRLIGILVGVAVSSAVHTFIWPEKEDSAP